MQWGSWSEFWAMGGYGLYVWGSYLVTVVCLVAEMLVLRARRREVMQHLDLAMLGAETERADETQA